MATRSYREFAEGHFLTRDAMVFCWQQYLAQRREPYGEPLHAATLRGLPPATILSCEYDPLRDEAEGMRSGCVKRVWRYAVNGCRAWCMPAFTCWG